MSAAAPDAAAAAAMLQQMQLLSAQVHELQQHAMAAQRAGAPGGAPGVAAASPPRLAYGPRLPAPDAYDGRASSLDAWETAVEGQFTYYALADDANRMRVATAFLAGAALDWWRHAPQPRPATWAALVAALRARFQPVTSADTARAKLCALVQGRASANDYIAAFRRLLPAVPNMGEEDRLFHFMRGLRPAIAAQLRIHNARTLEAAVEMAARIGSLSELSLAATGAGAASAAHAAHAPMELDALDLTAGVEGLEPAHTGAAPDRVARVEQQLQALLNALREGGRAGAASASEGRGRPRFGGPPRIPHLTPTQVREYMDAGKCFGCGRTDHQSRACPKRTTGPDGRVSWGN